MANININPPSALQGDPKTQLSQIHSYLYQLSENLNMALNNISSNSNTYVTETRADGRIVTTPADKSINIQDLSKTYEEVKSLVIKSSDKIKESIKLVNDNLNKAIKTVDVFYAISTSSTDAPDTGWSTDPPTWEDGKFIWSKTKTIATDNTEVFTDPVCITGAKGEQGTQGLQGIQGPQGEQGIPGTAGTDGKTTYFHVKYSTNANGNPMTETPSTYIGTYVDYIENDSNDYTKYTWIRLQGLQGAKGDQGIPGTNGSNGQTSYLHIKYSNDGGTTFTANNGETVGSYLGTYTDFNQADSSNVTSYKWAKIKGEQGIQGLQGIQGPQGEQGIPGTAGTSSYFHIKYSPVSNPTNAQISETPNIYIGTYVDNNPTDSSNASSYTWYKLQGAQGPQGEQGIPGTNGSNGQTQYLHIAYATSANGSSGFSVSDSTNKTYIGTYADFTAADSTDYSKYTWTKIKGETGATGATGIGVSAIVEQYYLSTSNVSQLGGSWSNEMPTWASGKYIWTRSHITWTDNTTTDTSPVLAASINQANSNSTSALSKVNGMSIGDRNLLLDSGTEVSNTLYRINSYVPTSYLEAGQVYTIVICITPASGMTSIKPYLSGGNKAQGTISLSGTSRQIKTLTFTAAYNTNQTPADSSENANINIYRFPNPSTVTSPGEATIHWVKLVNGNKATNDWSAAPEEYDASIGNLQETTSTLNGKIDDLSAKIVSDYVAESDFGTYKENISDELTAVKDGIKQQMAYISELQTNTETTQAAFENYKIETSGYIQYGIAEYVEGTPRFGIAIGQDLTTVKVTIDGVEYDEINKVGFMATYTAEGMKLWQDNNLVAYMLNNKFFITRAEVTDELIVGDFKISKTNGFTIKYIGG